MSELFPSPNFDKAKESLIQHLKTNDILKDMNFTGAALNVLIDTMTYIYIHAQLYSNFALGESFLQTALYRKSVLQKASMLGYKPYQYKPAHARIRINFLSSNQNDPPVYFPAGIYFKGNNSKGQWTFSTRENTLIQQRSNGSYFADLDIYEGILIKETWVQDQWHQNKYIFQESKLDVDTLEVSVYNPVTNLSYLFKSYDNIDTLGPNEHIYYWREIDNDKIELYFGDDILSKKIEQNWVINASVFSCAGKNANEVTTFVIQDKGSLAGYDFTIETILPSTEAGDKQPDESIKFEAPHYYQRQDRNVTAEDYRTYLVSKFGAQFSHINVWGGEDNVPPRYGEVFCCLIPNEGVYLTDQLKTNILSSLSKYNVVTIRPQLVEAIPVYIDIICQIQYDKNKSNLRASEIEAKVKEIFEKQYIQSGMSEYKVVYSSTINKIQLVEDSIANIGYDEVFFQRFAPMNNLIYSYSFNFQNAIKPGSVYTSLWTSTAYPILGFNCQIQDDEEGNLIFYIDENRQGVVGSVDYDSGIVTINNFNFQGLLNNNVMTISCSPLLHNNSTKNDTILMLNNTTVNIQDINISAGGISPR